MTSRCALPMVCGTMMGCCGAKPLCCLQIDAPLPCCFPELAALTFGIRLLLQAL